MSTKSRYDSLVGNVVAAVETKEEEPDSDYSDVETTEDGQKSYSGFYRRMLRKKRKA